MARKPRQQSEAFADPPIFTIRGQHIILDADLARLYGVTTKALNQAVKRNEHRFPDDFVFQLKATEVENLRSSDRDQIAKPLSRRLMHELVTICDQFQPPPRGCLSTMGVY